MIEGEGTIEEFIVYPAPGEGESSFGSQDVTFSLETNWHGVYSGQYSGSTNDVGVWAKLFTQKHHINGVDTALFQMAPITAATKVIDAAPCPGTPALQLEFYVGGDSYGEEWAEYTFRNLWTICDPVAADWFG